MSSQPHYQQHSFFLPKGFWRPAFYTEATILNMMEQQKSGWAVCSKKIMNYIASHQIFLYLHRYQLLSNANILELVQKIPVLLPEEFCKNWEINGHWNYVIDDNYFNSEQKKIYSFFFNQKDIANVYSLSSPTHIHIWNEYLKTKQGLDAFAEAVQSSLCLWQQFVDEHQYLKSSEFEDLETISRHLFPSKQQAQLFLEVESKLNFDKNNAMSVLVPFLFEKIKATAEDAAKTLSTIFGWRNFESLFDDRSPLVAINAYKPIVHEKKEEALVKTMAEFNPYFFSEEWLLIRQSGSYLTLPSSKFTSVESNLWSSDIRFDNYLEDIMGSAEQTEEPVQLYLRGHLDNAKLVGQIIAQYQGMDLVEITQSSNMSLELFQIKNNKAFCFMNADKHDFNIALSDWKQNNILWYSEGNKEPNFLDFKTINVESISPLVTEQIVQQFIDLHEDEEVSSWLGHVHVLVKIKQAFKESSSQHKLPLSEFKHLLSRRISSDSFQALSPGQLLNSHYELSTNKNSDLYSEIVSNFESNHMFRNHDNPMFRDRLFLLTGQDHESKETFSYSLGRQLEVNIFEIHAEKIKRASDAVWLKVLACLEKSSILFVKNFDKSRFQPQLIKMAMVDEGSSIVILDGVSSNNSEAKSIANVFDFKINDHEKLKRGIKTHLKAYWNNDWSPAEEDSIFSLLLSQSASADPYYIQLERKLKQHVTLHPGNLSHKSMLNIVVQLFHGFISDINQSIDNEQLYNTAVHECGHAICAFRAGIEVPFLTGVSMSKLENYAAGYAEFKKNHRVYNRSVYLDEIAANFGGIAAEQVVFGEYGTGGITDIKNASDMIDDLIRNRGWGYQGPYVSKALSENHKYQDEPIYWAKQIFEFTVAWLAANKDLLIEMSKELHAKKFMLKEDLDKYAERVKKLPVQHIAIPQWTPGALEARYSSTRNKDMELSPEIQEKPQSEAHTLHQSNADKNTPSPTENKPSAKD